MPQKSRKKTIRYFPLLFSKILFLFLLFLFVCSLALLIFNCNDRALPCHYLNNKIAQISPISLSKAPSPAFPTSEFQNLTPIVTILQVHDGDTIYIKGIKEGIRLIGIDAPELKYSYKNCASPNSAKCKTNECGAIEAKNRLKELVSNKEIHLATDPQIEDKDKYGRLLRYVFLCSPSDPPPQQKTPDLYPSRAPEPKNLSSCSDISLVLLKEGLVREASFGTNYSKQKEYKKAELEAKNKNLGIWKNCKTNPL